MEQLRHMHQGSNAIESAGQDLANNALDITDAALRADYTYGKGEALQSPQIALASPENALKASVQPIDVASSELVVLDGEQIEGGDRWTQQSLKKRFGRFETAYQHLRDVHGIRPTKRSWQSVVDGFNGLLHQTEPSPSPSPIQRSVANESAREERGKPLLHPEERLSLLEQTVAVQQRQIFILEQQVQELIQQLTDGSDQPG